MSEQTIKSRKLVFLPLFIILNLLFLCGFAFKVNASETTVLYTVQLKKLHPDVLSSLISGAEVTDAVSKSFVGQIENIAITPHMNETYSSSHDCFMQVPHPYFRDATITVRALCAQKKNGYQIGSFFLFRGAVLHFFTADFTGTGECTAIYESEILP